MHFSLTGCENCLEIGMRVMVDVVMEWNFLVDDGKREREVLCQLVGRSCPD